MIANLKDFRNNVFLDSPETKEKTGEARKQKGKKKRGLGKGIFALLRFNLERFRFSLIKRKSKQKFFQFLLKEKNGGRKKLKKCIEKISVLATAELARRAETQIVSQRFALPRARSARQSSGFCSK